MSHSNLTASFRTFPHCCGCHYPIEKPLEGTGTSALLRESSWTIFCAPWKYTAPSEGGKQANKKKHLQSDAALRVEKAPCSAPPPKRETGETGESENMGSNISQVEGQSTVLLKAEEERFIKKYMAVVKPIQSVTLLQKKRQQRPAKRTNEAGDAPRSYFPPQ